MSNKSKKLLVITNAPTILKEGKYQSYPPYVNEMDIWFKYVDEVKILAPFNYPTEIFLKPFKSNNIGRIYIPFISFYTFKYFIMSIVQIPIVLIQLFYGMFWANHIHFRCPGNVGLLGCFVQIFFPFKKKSTKYAGNWDPKSKQPWSYKLQQAILRNTFLTRNMKVLVYGEWSNETKNIYSFVSATYNNVEKVEYKERDYKKTLQFVFAGTLVVGKRPLLTIQIIEGLINKGIKANLHMFGDGPLMLELQGYVKTQKLEQVVFLYGNKDKEVVKTKMINAHFSILPSKSEGWPKAIAEGMFFGAIPISTKISCLEWILDYGKRGILIEPEINKAVNEIIFYLEKRDLNKISASALNWSQQYTLESLEKAIKSTLK